jgi:hypothetical protein
MLIENSNSKCGSTALAVGGLAAILALPAAGGRWC